MIKFNRDVTIAWVEEHLGGCFYDDAPDVFDDLDPEEVEYRFIGTIENRHFFEHYEIYEVVEGTLTMSRRGGQTFSRYYNRDTMVEIDWGKDPEPYPDWEEVK